MGRFGGEEFVVMLPETRADEAETIAERLRKIIAATPIQTDEADIMVTASIGVASMTRMHKSVEDIISAADFALYEAKRAGRNKVVRSAGSRDKC